MYSIILTLTKFQHELRLYWFCLYSEEKSDTMECNLKFETFPTGVKMFDQKQYVCPDDKHIIYY